MATIAIAADHGGYALKQELVVELKKQGHELQDLGTNDLSSVDYPDFATKVTDAINGNRAQLGILVCGTGIGMSITANKVHGIRAALCHSEFDARFTRLHNDANVLCLGERTTGGGLALAIAETFVATSFEGGRHARRIEKIRAVEAKR